LSRLIAGQQLHRRAKFRPLSDPPLCNLDATRRVHRLHPAGLFELGLDLIAPCEIEQYRSAVTQQGDETFAGGTVLRDDVVRVGP
jgi:hypothetical protein